MKLAEIQNKIGSSGIKETAKCKIEANYKSFKAIVGDIYKDKIKAIIRELSANAVDAHKEADTLDTPYIIKLPSTFDANFSIRDFGTGMSQEKIMGKPGIIEKCVVEYPNGRIREENRYAVEPTQGLYNTLFKSDKDTSNEYVGCWGIGSKTPLGYVNTFSLTSWYGGEKKVYFIGFNADSEIDVNLVHSEPSDEANGIEVSFSVEQNDIQRFANKAVEIYKYFKYRPTITGTQIEIPELKFLLEGNGWGFTGNESMAVMGSMPYPIEFSHFQSNSIKQIHPEALDRYKNLSDCIENKYQQLIKAGVHIDFNMGTLEMTPSRDSLQYTKKTIQTICIRFDEILSEINSLINDKFIHCKNMWEARKLYSNLTVNNVLCKLINTVDIKFNGEVIKKTIKLRSNDKYSTVGIYDNIPGTTITKLHKYVYSSRIKKTTVVETISVDASFDEERILIYNDIKTGAYARARNQLIIGTNKINTAYVIEFQDNIAKQIFCKVMGFDESFLIKASTLPKAYSNTTGGSGKILEKVFVLNQNIKEPRSLTSSNWNADNVDFAQGGIYVDICHYRPKLGGKRTKNSLLNLYEICRKFTVLGLTMPPIVGVKTSAINKFNKSSKWVELTDYIQIELNKFYDTHQQLLADINIYEDLENKEYLLKIRYNKIRDKSKPLALFLKRLKTLHNKVSTKRALLHSYNNILASLHIKSNVPNISWNDERKNLEKTYPILDIFDSIDSCYFSDKEQLKAVEIINFYDAHI